jgi:uncharacterized protein YuzE
MPPDEFGSSYVYTSAANGGQRVKSTVPATVNLDLNEAGEIVGIEILDSPPFAV